VNPLAVGGGSRTEHDVSNNAARAQAERRRGTPRSGGPAGRLIVGEHVGHAAAQAAQAVRRAGLRPGLERSFGGEAEQVGLVVAQDPSAGSELARNGMVTLYVAAPGPAPTHESCAPEADSQRMPAAPVPSAGRPARERAPLDSGVRRARKPRPAAEARSHALDPGAAIRSGDEPLGALAVGKTSMIDARSTDTETPQGLEVGDAACGEEEHPTQPHGRLTVALEDPFSGSAGEQEGWRRVYPRRPVRARIRGALRWLGSHRLLALALCALLVLWADEAVTGALAPQRTRAPVASTLSTPDPATRSPQGIAGAAQPQVTHVARAGGRHAAIQRRRGASRRATSEARRPPGVATPAVGVGGPSMPLGNPPAPAPAPVSQQASGGPFSP
jgi:hypothetical protein